MIYKISRASRLKYFIVPMIVQLILTLIIVVILFFASENVDSVRFVKGLVIILSYIMLFFYIPLIIFYYNYSKINKGAIFTIDSSQEVYEYQKENERIIFEKQDIDKIEVHVSIPSYYNRFIWNFWQDFFYSSIQLKNGKSVIITCLMCDNLIDHFNADLIVRKKSFIAHCIPK